MTTEEAWRLPRSRKPGWHAADAPRVDGHEWMRYRLLAADGSHILVMCECGWSSELVNRGGDDGTIGLSLPRLTQWHAAHAQLESGTCIHNVSLGLPPCANCLVSIDPNPGRPFADLRDLGLLWLLNRVVFHPRGYAFALHFADGGEGGAFRDCTGWSLIGDGTEPWTMGDPPEEDRRYGAKTEDEQLALIKTLMP